MVNLSLLISRATRVEIQTYESPATLWSCTLPHVCMLCVVCLGWAQVICRNKMLSFILLIPLTKLTNQNRGICRDLILYPLRLRPSFPNDVKILRPKVGFGPNRLKIDLRSFNMKNITFYEQINLILKNKRQRHVYAGTDLCT